MTPDSEPTRGKEPIHIISLGAGVQSSVMALMAANGEITPMPVAAIFADTQAEPQSVYRWLDWIEKQLPFPVKRVTAGSLTEISTTPRKSLASGNLYLPSQVPVFVLNANGSNGQPLRQCTDKHKLAPLRKAILWELGKDDTACVWIGISKDEWLRGRPSNHSRIEHRWPLLNLGMTRKNCLEWMEKNGLPKPPRSACSYCPYHNDKEWRRLKDEEPEAFADAVDYERKIQIAYSHVARLTGKPFLHSKRIPLSEVDFSTEEERGQLNMFNNECEGMCGV